MDQARPALLWVWAAAWHVGAGGVHLRVDGEGGDVDRPVALDDLALVVHEDQVGGPDEAERQAERVHPEAVGALRVAGGEVAGHALVEAEAVEQAEGGRHALLDVGALLVGRGELRGACAVGWVSRRASSGRVPADPTRRRPPWPAAVPSPSQSSATRSSTRAVAAHRLVVDPPVAGLVDEADDAVRPRHGGAGCRGRPCRRRSPATSGDLLGDPVDERAHARGVVAALGRVLDHEAVEVRLPLDEADVGVDRGAQQLAGGGVGGEGRRDRASAGRPRTARRWR